MNTTFKRITMVIILMLLVSLACSWTQITPFSIVDPNENPSNSSNAASTSTIAPEATADLLKPLEEQLGTAMGKTLSAMETEDAELTYGVKPQKVICEGNYITTVTNVEDPDETCSFDVPFKLEFWNVGAVGGVEYAGATLYWHYVDFQWGSCSVDKMTETTSTGTSSGGPNGLASVEWASIQLSSGLTGSLSYSDEDESASGTCTIENPAVFSGWTGP